MSLYDSLDDLIVAAIRDGELTEFHRIERAVRTEADGMAQPNRRGEREGWRVVDRRLQALRKAGRLEYDRKRGWRVPASQGAG